MADVTISSLSQAPAAGSALLPFSNGSSTLSVPVSAIFHYAGNIGIGVASPTVKLDVEGVAIANYFALKTNTASAPFVDAAITRPADGNLALITFGAERLRIDASGRVTTPFQPAFHVWNQSAQALGGGSVMLFNATSTNASRVFNRGGHYANNRFTAPVAGVYQFSANVLQNSTTRGSYWGIGLVLNGTDTIEFSYAAGTSQQSLNVSATIKLAANDYIDVRASTDGVINIDNSGTFSGHLVG